MDGDDPVKAALTTLLESGKKYVPESDLIAAKKGLEGQLEESRTQTTTAKTESDERHQQVLTQTAAKEAAESKISDQSKLLEQIKGLETKLTETTTGRDQLTERLVGLKRMAVAQRTGRPIEEFKEKDEAQLDSLMEALNIVKPDGKDGAGGGQSYDGGAGSGGGTGTEKPTGRALIKQGLRDRK